MEQQLRGEDIPITSSSILESNISHMHVDHDVSHGEVYFVARNPVWRGSGETETVQDDNYIAKTANFHAYEILRGLIRACSAHD